MSVPVLNYNEARDTMKIRAEAVWSNGYYRLRMEKSGLYLTVYKSSAASGTKVIQYPKVDKDGQYWQILLGPEDGYYLSDAQVRPHLLPERHQGRSGERRIPGDLDGEGQCGAVLAAALYSTADPLM